MKSRSNFYRGISLVLLVLAITLRGSAQTSAEIRVTDYLLKRPVGLTKVLGKVVKRTECADTDGRQMEYEHGYPCINNGVVVLFGYDLRHRVKSPEEALRAVGLEMTAQPVHFGVGYTWAKSLGNPLGVGKRLATRVTVGLGEQQGVIVKLGPE